MYGFNNWRLVKEALAWEKTAKDRNAIILKLYTDKFNKEYLNKVGYKITPDQTRFMSTIIRVIKNYYGFTIDSFGKPLTVGSIYNVIESYLREIEYFNRLISP